MYYNTK